MFSPSVLGNSGQIQATGEKQLGTVRIVLSLQTRRLKKDNHRKFLCTKIGSPSVKLSEKITNMANKNKMDGFKLGRKNTLKRL